METYESMKMEEVYSHWLNTLNAEQKQSMLIDHQGAYRPRTTEEHVDNIIYALFGEVAA